MAHDNGLKMGSTPRGKFARAAKMTRSGLRRYPRQLIDSIRERGSMSHLPAETCAFDPDRFATSELAAVWLGHATVLIRLAGKTIITDPVFSQRVGLTVGGFCFGVSRLAPVAMCLDRLPPIDVVLLSHAHFDHLDRPSLRRLATRGTTVVTARSTRRLVPSGFGDVIELDWSRFVDVGGLRLTSVEPAHWGARAGLDRHRRYNSYLIDTVEKGREDQGRRVLFGGDTAMTDAFNGLGPVDLAIFGIGAYEPWSHHHANPEQVWAMFHSLGGERLLPMHHSTFPLGEEHRDEPLRRLLAVAGAQQERVVGKAMGEMWVTERGRGPADRRTKNSSGATTCPL
ncbi:MAG: MBL fold metallo-hydrolase [Phycisphaerales bacterium]|nr:MBL fold metallo-hydrolase [Phycisphaerales bacterium]